MLTCRFLQALEIEPLHIEKGKPWQNLIEAQFKVQLRLADFKFEQAQTLEEMQNEHADFIETFNTTRHYAHRKRADGYRTPVDVLGWLRGRRVEAKALRELFRRSEFLRTVNRYGFVSVQRFYIYAESGLSRKRVLIWIYEGELSIEYQQTVVARYRCDYDPRHKAIQGMSDPTLYHTRFTPPQLELIELDDEQWVKFQQRPVKNLQQAYSHAAQTTSLARSWGLGPDSIGLKSDMKGVEIGLPICVSFHLTKCTRTMLKRWILIWLTVVIVGALSIFH